MSDVLLPSQPGNGGLLRAVKSVWALIVAIVLGLYLLDAANFDGVMTIAVEAFLGTLPYIALAVFLLAFLKASGAENMVAKAFQGNETHMIFFAALIGGLAPFCSCEVIPFIAGLLSLGAPLSAVMAFWLSSPLIDPPTVLITAGALGWSFGIGKAVAAVLLGIGGGFAVKLAMGGASKGSVLREDSPFKPKGCCSAKPFQGKVQWAFWQAEGGVETFRAQSLENGLFLVKWLALAYVLEGLVITYVPAEAVATIVGGDGIMDIVIGALVGAPAYLNSYAAPALVAALMEQGMSAGAAMAFLIAGAVSSLPAMAAVWSLVRPSIFAAYLGLGIGGAIVLGLGFQLVLPLL